ncbi:MAG: T9SS type A sorting domain-containing protein [Candidatus Marinimicrobia bacterium]|nr:T9SS type A sorting domain-containing protein [Candidatus Neomarinimicrobiota bacterium]MCF7829802.1 T9SS type A sorting domain-containing protein [Candidatus Neomarinimicrobiota bacterium]MCF7881765.1 T9SS type A sorting domain-containing protein [Candidatus Neomarinimicrobiota bacterium]
MRKWKFPDPDVGILASEELPGGFSLEANYPNPFNPSTTITWNLPEQSNVRLRIFNVRGQPVLEKHFGLMDAGRHKWTWSVAKEQLPSGIYWLELSALNEQRTRKMTSLK